MERDPGVDEQQFIELVETLTAELIDQLRTELSERQRIQGPDTED